MHDEIKVRVVEFGDRRHYQMQYTDPTTGRKKTRSTGVERTGRKKERTEAERAAAKWEDELRTGRYVPRSKITWADFRDRYESEALSGLASATEKKVAGVFNTVESILSPNLLRDVTAEQISHLQAKLREAGKAESTIASHLRHLRAALQWAVNVGLLAKAPKVAKVRRAKLVNQMKGRPVTGEEFDRMLTKIADVVLAPAELTTKDGKPRRLNHKPLEPHERALIVDSWRHYLRGLWLSGLRLEESLSLWWDRTDRLCVELDGKRPMLRIPAELEKGHKDRLLPITPDFADFLMETPEADRTGPVFNPLGLRDRDGRLGGQQVARTVKAIGEKAGIKVDERDGKVKFATAHDLRRSFGQRWSHKVMPQVLMVLMRHESIETTLRYYVGRNAEATADVLWQEREGRSGNTSGNTRLKSPSAADSQMPQPPVRKGG